MSDFTQIIDEALEKWKCYKESVGTLCQRVAERVEAQMLDKEKSYERVPV